MLSLLTFELRYRRAREGLPCDFGRKHDLCAKPDRSGVTNIENMDERDGFNSSEFLLAS